MDSGSKACIALATAPCSTVWSPACSAASEDAGVKPGELDCRVHLGRRCHCEPNGLESGLLPFRDRLDCPARCQPPGPRDYVTLHVQVAPGAEGQLNTEVHLRQLVGRQF